MSVKRNTKQRAVILQILDTVEQHPSASWIFAEARKVLPQISLGTVYRVLDALVDEGRICRLVMEDGSSRYERQDHLHPHVFCRSCGRVVDAPPIELTQVLAHIGHTTGYQIASFQLNGYGLCPACQDTPSTAHMLISDKADSVSRVEELLPKDTQE